MKEIFAIIKKTRYYPKQWLIRHVDEKHAFIFIPDLLRAGVKDVLFSWVSFMSRLIVSSFPKGSLIILLSRLERSSRIHAQRRLLRRRKSNGESFGNRLPLLSSST